MFKIIEFDIDQINLDEFIEMYKLCLNKKIDKKYIQWKYRENPAGSMCGFIAYDVNSKMAAFYGVIPERFEIEGKSCIVYQSVDTMTHPNYQKMGLFTALAKKTYEKIYSKTDNQFIFGIPGSNSFHGFIKKLNWKFLGNINYIFCHKLRFISFNKFNSNTTVLTLNDDINELTDFFKNNFCNEMIHLNYSINYFNWKIANYPFDGLNTITLKKNNVITSFLVFSIDNKNRCFVECYLSLEKTGKDLKLIIEYLFTKTNSYWIYTWDSVIFKKIGFIKNPFEFGPFSYKMPFIIFSNISTQIFDKNNFRLEPIIQDK